MGRKAAPVEEPDEPLEPVVNEEVVEPEVQDPVEPNEPADQPETEVGDGPGDDLLFEVDIPTDDGSFETEQIDLNDLPAILAGARKVMGREAALHERETQLNSSRELLNFVTKDELTKAVTQYRLQGVSEFEVIEQLYNWYLANGQGPTQQDEDINLDPEVAALKKKVTQYDQFFETQARQRSIDENNMFLAQQAQVLGYSVDDQDLPLVINTANQVAAEVFAELAPDIPVGEFTARRKITPKLAKMIWDETADRLQGKMKKGGVAPASAAQKLAARVRPLQAQVKQAKDGIRPPRILSGKSGQDVTSGAKTPAPVTATKNGSTSSERAKALKALFS